MRELKETHMSGMISIENKDTVLNKENEFGQMIIGDLGIQIATDGRIWICINGISFLRFKPLQKEVTLWKTKSRLPLY